MEPSKRKSTYDEKAKFLAMCPRLLRLLREARAEKSVDLEEEAKREMVRALVMAGLVSEKTYFRDVRIERVIRRLELRRLV